MWVLLLISFLMFLRLLTTGALKKEELKGKGSEGKTNWILDMTHGQLRSAIAGTLVFGFVILTMFSLYYPVDQGTIFTQYAQFVGIIIGFYFGSRTAAAPGLDPARIQQSEMENGAKQAMAGTAKEDAPKVGPTPGSTPGAGSVPGSTPSSMPALGSTTSAGPVSVSAPGAVTTTISTPGAVTTTSTPSSGASSVSAPAAGSAPGSTPGAGPA